MATFKMWQQAFFNGKVCCPHQCCTNKPAFYNKAGLEQHYRAAHKNFGEETVKEAEAVFKNKHSEHVFEELSRLYGNPSSETETFQTVSGIFPPIFLNTKRAEMAAKLYAMFLFYKGLLKPYKLGPEAATLITAENNKMSVSFHCWSACGGKNPVIYAKAIKCIQKAWAIEPEILKKSETSCDSDDIELTEVTGTPSGSYENDSLLFVLQKYFGYEIFKDFQREAVETVLMNRDCIITMPTGSGKTVCYTIPTIISGGTSVVVSPLLSLIYNQVKSLREKGVSATHITSQMAPAERNTILHSLLKPKPDFQFLYCTPELLSCTDITTTLHKMVCNKTLVNVIIDEAHCVDMWGHDFRPSYCDLGNLKLGVPLVCFTATLTDRALSSVTQSLKLTNPIIKKAPCERVNLCLHVVDKTGRHPRDIASQILTNFQDKSGIVYCHSREQTQNMAYELAAAGVQASFYHARLDIDLKMERQKKWEDGMLKVLCATSAFGMGIDKKNVRFVIHATVPGSPEQYIQETGRCARDGNKGVCYLYFNFNDRTTHLRNINDSPNQTRKGIAFERLNRMVEYCISNKCRAVKLQEMMGEEKQISKCGQCDVCIANKCVHIENCSQYAKLIVNCIIAMKSLEDKITFTDAIMVFRGSKVKKLEKFFHISQHGSGRAISKQKATRLLQELILSGVIVENLHGFSKTAYLSVGNMCSALFDGTLEIQM